MVMDVVGSLLVVIIMLAPNVAIGASLNCSKAGTSVEKTICASKTLSRLIGQLAKAYESVLLLSDRPATVKSQQKAWLRNIRDKCQDETCLQRGKIGGKSGSDSYFLGASAVLYALVMWSCRLYRVARWFLVLRFAMPRLPRYPLVAVPQHVIQRGHNRQPVFFHQDDYRMYLHCLHAAATV
jgi:uncharacterized protein YecT (DUF1311 family)